MGAALLTTRGEIVTGCNVENASYGMTNCAERTAIFSAVSQLGPKLEIRAIAVVNAGNAPCAPCGACRQVIYEFGPEGDCFFPERERLEGTSDHRPSALWISSQVNDPARKLRR